MIAGYFDYGSGFLLLGTGELSIYTPFVLATAGLLLSLFAKKDIFQLLLFFSHLLILGFYVVVFLMSLGFNEP